MKNEGYWVPLLFAIFGPDFMNFEEFLQSSLPSEVGIGIFFSLLGVLKNGF